jgi:hypothetical protein
MSSSPVPRRLVAVSCPPGTRPVGSLNAALVIRFREVPASNLGLEKGHSVVVLSTFK